MRAAPAPNSLLHHLAYTVAIIESMLSGDAAPAFWRLHGQQLAMVTYIGMHAAQNDASYVPTAASEARRRLASQSFVVDKVAACFNGRPPLLSRKYMLTPLPLDLPDEVLLSGPEPISRAVAALDEKGWNTDGKVYPTTILRARRMLASVTDEVMEVSLGDPASTSIEALLALRQREIDAFAALPRALMYSPEDIRDPRVEGSMLYTKILIHLEHLQNIFCIGRLLVQWGFDNHAELLQVMAFAAPAGGVLCNELLRPSQQRNSPVEGVTRSSIIQQLSLLNGFLQWVSPHAPNGDLCTSCKTVIQHVLDHALNPPPQGSLDAAANNAFDLNLDLSSDINVINGYFNFDLLDTYEWLRPEMLSNQSAG
ncbi:hypothetical protein SLS53_006193 [Cytospora paraplurivora]|uniref:Xylanolytic transcriptional activator regulatory domain-containing protein n=1 Tax=Cytospora paraplurivora TaxID=2898453 RepID=A0AAN9U3Z2_9PEZI